MSALYPDALVATTLRDWSSAAEEALALEEYQLAAQLAQVVLRRMPRHLATYQRLIEITWQLKRWDEGEDWGRRLLQADPGNGAAWRSLGRAAEQRDLRSQAHTIYQRAFEIHPYDPEVRAGLSRTGLEADRELSLNLACLGALYLKGRRWAHAQQTYRTLVRAEPRRSDFQALLCFALWQNRAHKEAYRLARHLTQAHPNLLLAWIVLNALGNERDRALARNPLESMDPDGEYARLVYDLPAPARAVKLAVTQTEARLLEEFMQAAGFVEDAHEATDSESDADTEVGVAAGANADAENDVENNAENDVGSDVESDVDSDVDEEVEADTNAAPSGHTDTTAPDTTAPGNPENQSPASLPHP